MESQSIFFSIHCKLCGNVQFNVPDYSTVYFNTQCINDLGVLFLLSQSVFLLRRGHEMERTICKYHIPDDHSGDFILECSVHGFHERKFCPCFAETDILKFVLDFENLDYDYKDLAIAEIKFAYEAKDVFVIANCKEEEE